MDTKKTKINTMLYTTLALLLLLGIGFGSFTSHPPEKSEDESATPAGIQTTAGSRQAINAGAAGPDWKATAQDALGNVDVSTRIRAVLELRKQFSLEAVELLAKFLDDHDNVIQSEAIDALGYIALNSGLTDDVFKILLKKAMDKNYAAHGQALITSAMLGQADLILPVIDDYISEKDRERTSYAVKALSFIAGPKCIPLLTKILEFQNDPEIQQNAFMILAKIDTPEARSILRDYVFSLNVDEQMNSAWAVARLNKPEYNSILIDAIEKDELDQYAIGSIASSPGAPEVFNELLQNDGIDKERKRKWLQTLAKNSVYAQGDTRKAIDDIVNENKTEFDPDGPGRPDDPSKNQPEQPEDTEIREGYQKLPEVFFNNAQYPKEQNLAWLAWKERARPKNDPTDQYAYRDFQDLIAATKHSDPIISKDAVSFKASHGL